MRTWEPRAPPEACSPDAEGVTWYVDPYGGRAYAEWTFHDHVEQALHNYVISARPFSRQDVDALLALGVGSVDDLEEIATEQGSHQQVATWLLAELRKGSRTDKAVSPQRSTWFELQRARSDPADN